MVATPSHPVDLVRMSIPVRMQVTRPRRGLMLAVRSWSLLSLSLAIASCLQSHGTAHAYMISVPAGPTVTSVCVTHWRPTPASAERLELSCSGGARHCVVSETHTALKTQVLNQLNYWTTFQNDHIMPMSTNTCNSNWDFFISISKVTLLLMLCSSTPIVNCSMMLYSNTSRQCATI